jgi:hypothetical protein
MKTTHWRRGIVITCACLAAALVHGAPYWMEQLQLHVTVRPSADLGVAPNSMFNPRFFDGDIYANQINNPCFGRYHAGSGSPELVVDNTANPLWQHRMVAPFRGPNRSAYLLGSSSGAGPTTTLSRYDFDGHNRVDIAAPDGQTVEGFDWVNDTTIIFTCYSGADNQKRLYLADVTANPFAVSKNTRWNTNGYALTSVSTRIRNVRVGDKYSGFAYYGDASQNSSPRFYALNLTNGVSSLLGNAGTLTGSGSFGLWTVVERGGYLYVQTTDNGIQVYNMVDAVTLGSLYTTYAKDKLDALTGGSTQYYGLDVTPDGATLLLGGLEGKVAELGTPLQVPAQRAAYVIHISVDALRPDAITTLGPANLPNFYRLRTQGAFTDNARSDYDYTLTLPNHTTELTGRGVLGASGHGWNSNTDPAPTQTLASNKGAYVAGVFDVAHDHGLRTGAFPSKGKFSLFDTSWNASNGAPDTTPPDQGQDKIDTYLYLDDTAALVNALVTNMAARPFHYAFIHLRDTDTIGESQGFNLTPGSAYCNTVKAMDSRLGAIFSLVDTNAQLRGRTAIILVADHGGYDFTHADASRREAYTVPFYVWGPGVMAGADLYALNPARRLNPGTNRPPYSAPVQPVRNGETANLALSLLGLGPVPGSTLNYLQDLALTVTPPADFRLTALGANTTVSFTLASGVLYDLQSCDNLASGAWSPLVTNLSGAGGTVTNLAVGPAAGPERFYRLKLHF